MIFFSIFGILNPLLKVNLVNGDGKAGTWIIITLATSGDQIHPGETELTLSYKMNILNEIQSVLFLILKGARSRAMSLVSMLIAPLEAA